MDTRKFTASITLEERGGMEKFKDYLDDQEIDYDEDKFDTSFLIRFLRARKLDIKKSAEMFNNYLQWRIDEDIDNIHVNFHYFKISYTISQNKSQFVRTTHDFATKLINQ